MSIGLISEDLKKFTRLAANVSEAHTAALFLPTGLLSPSPHTVQPLAKPPLPLKALTPHASVIGKLPANNDAAVQAVSHAPSLPQASIEMVAVASLSAAVVRDSRIQVGHGLLGWVSENGRPIHVAPFEMESSTLGVYSDSEPIKSLVAVPIPMPIIDPHGEECSGVLMCDSRKPLSFTKAQVRNLEEIATLISRLLYWTLFRKEISANESSWDAFITKMAHLTEAIGNDSVEVARISIETFEELEAKHGITFAVQQSEQFLRLIQQALPPHFPCLRLPTGEIVIALDNMMSTFFQTKIRSLAQHLNEHASPFTIEIRNFSAKGIRGASGDIDSILKVPPTSTLSKAVGGSRA